MSRETHHILVKQRMKDLQINSRDIARYVVLSEDVINLWLSSKITLPFLIVWKIYHLLNLDEIEDISQQK